VVRVARKLVIRLFDSWYLAYVVAVSLSRHLTAMARYLVYLNVFQHETAFVHVVDANLEVSYQQTSRSLKQTFEI